MTFGADTYALIRDGCQRSAGVVVPLVLDHLLHVHSVVDVGCGEGWWAAEFARHGCRVVGIDGGPTAAAAIPYRQHDLRDRLPKPRDPRRFDLAVSLEVAEHLPAERAESFIADLCALAPIVLFSAAIPGQGGHGHLTERWPCFWVERFADHGYRCSGALRWSIWDDGRVENWYRQNLLVAACDDLAHGPLFDGPMAEPWAVVHPVLFEARTS